MFFAKNINFKEQEASFVVSSAKGRRTYKLRKGKKHSAVKKYEFAKIELGGDGVTIVDLK